MMPKFMLFFTMAFSLPLATAADFHKSWNLVNSSRITVFTVYGDIKISGYDGEKVTISAVKNGPDRDSVVIQDDSYGDHIRLFSKYLDFSRGNANVDYEILVPRENFYQLIYLKSNSGKITVTDVSGSMIRVETVSRGIVLRDVAGTVSAASISGEVRGYLNKLSRHSVLHFSSGSGNVSVWVPADLSAQIHLESGSGQIKTDFTLEAKAMRYGPGKFIHDKLGDSNNVLDIRSAMGSVSFLKNVPANRKNSPEIQ